jgi:signal transduction histidine kinase
VGLASSPNSLSRKARRSLLCNVVADQQATTERHSVETELVGVQDASRLDRLFSKLPSNAIKFSPTGGPITIVPSNSNDESGPWAVLNVTDH